MMEEKFLKVIEKFKKETEKECYKVSFTKEMPSILDDKIGGKPYLPIGEEYPKDKNGNNMPLLLQVNLKNIDLKGYPKHGILEIFTDKDVDYPCQFVIKYFEDGLEYQTKLPEVDMSSYIVDHAIKIETSKDICHMNINDYRFIDIMCKIVNEVYDTNVSNYGQLDDFFGNFAWYDKIRDGIINHSANIGGYPDFIQTDPRASELKGKEECLFKLDSWGHQNLINIGDSGILFTLISKEDIEKCNFENAIVDWDCC